MNKKYHYTAVAEAGKLADKKPRWHSSFALNTVDEAESSLNCPITRGLPVTMFRKSFIKHCLKFQERSGVIETDGEPLPKNAKKSYRCSNCTIGKNVREKKKFKPLKEVKFYKQNTKMGCNLS